MGLFDGDWCTDSSIYLLVPCALANNIEVGEENKFLRLIFPGRKLTSLVGWRVSQIEAYLSKIYIIYSKLSCVVKVEFIN